MASSEVPMTEETEISIPLDYFHVQMDLKLGTSRSEVRAFHRFSQARVSTGVIKLMGALFIPFIIYVYVMALRHAKTRDFIGSIAFVVVWIRNPMLAAFFYFQDRMKRGHQTTFLVRLKPWMPAFANGITVFSCLTIGLFLIARVLNGDCHSIDQYHMYGCDSGRDSQLLPQGHELIIMLLPIVLSTILKGIKTPMVVLCWLIGIAFISVAIVIAGAMQSILPLIIYVPISAAILYENHRQNIILFLVLRKQQTLLEENRVLAEAAQNELRFMIANMAHDLKTPLSSFMNGVETLSSLFGDLTKATTAEKAANLQTGIDENIKNLFNVNNFMTMTVNRCIDYMKASKGIKLEPRLETIHLQEVLSMPLNCMRDLQSRIAINQAPIPESVCSHIITDLQWFQENLFCLISNAVKYSSHGHITVSVALVTEHHATLISAREGRGEHSPRRSSGSHSDLESLAGESYSFLDRLPAREAREALTNTSLERMENCEGEAAKKRPSLTSLAGRQRSLEMKLRLPLSHFTSSSPSQEFLLIEVEDTGIGLSDEMKAALFTPFKQAQRRAGGTGLGLYSLAKRVDALGGYYGVCNRRDGEQGSIFWFAIPYRPDSVEAAAAERPMVSLRAMAAATFSGFLPSVVVVRSASGSPRSKKPSPTGRITPKAGQPPSLRVLLVDDSLTILKMTSNLLKRNGHTIDTAENGADALTRLEKARSEGIQYDVMLIDLNMPVMDGLEATKRLRETENSLNAVSVEVGGVPVHQRVFAFSANSDRETMQEAMEAGADDYLCKPFSIQTFHEKCAAVLAERTDRS